MFRVTCGETKANSNNTEPNRNERNIDAKNVTETFLSELFRKSKVDLSRPGIIKKCI